MGSSSPPRFCSVGLDGREHRRPTPEWASPSFPKPSGGFLLLSTPLVMPKSVLDAELRTGPVGTERSRPRGLERGRGARGVWGLASSQARGCPTRVPGREGPHPPPRPRRTLSPACTVGRGALKSCPLHSVQFTLLPSKFISELIAPSELLKLCFVRDVQRDINEKAPVCPAAPPTRGVNRWARALARPGRTPLGPLSGGDHRPEAGGLYPRALA